MNVSLTPELEQLVQDKVKSGRYLSASEVVRAGLRLLEERDRIYQARLAELQQEITIGVEEADRGELIDGEEVMQEIYEELRQAEEAASEPSMTKNYRFTRTAQKDLKAIKNYIAARNLPAACRLADAVFQKCQTLGEFPEMGFLWEDLVPPLRSFTVDRYLIFYRPAKDGIQVMRIVSGYRDLGEIFPELDDT